MSSILAIIGAGSPADDAVVHGMVRRMARRGAERVGTARVAGAALAVARNEWETASHLAGPAAVATHGPYAVVSDAAIHYRDDLRRRLDERGVRAETDSPSALIAAAYAAFGARCVDVLEGNFAFVVWDSQRRELFAARDYGGTRPLHYAQVGDAFVVASTMGGVLAFPGCSPDLDEVAIAQAAAMYGESEHDTVYRSIKRIAAGRALTHAGGRAAVRRYWEPPAFAGEGRERQAFDDAALELRELLTRAAGERMPPASSATVTMSGGWDSTSVFGAGQHHLERSARRGSDLVPVSVSYPVGDEGREDEFIELVARRWNANVHWVPIDTVPLFDDLARGAAERDDPFHHLFEGFNRTLARASRETGARVTMNGNGGDLIFQVEVVYLADMLARGDVAGLMREWRSIGGKGWRPFVKWALLPLLGPGALDLLGRIRGAPVKHYLEPALPSWIRPDFARRHGLRERLRAAWPSKVGAGAASYEKRWYLLHSYFPKVAGVVGDMTLEEGLEQRAPLMDERVIRFAAGRPRTDRRSGNETKRLLRKAMQGLVPDEVLAPRSHRTGTLGGYLARGLRAQWGAVSEAAFASPVLAEFGIIDATELKRASKRSLRTSDYSEFFRLYQTLQMELWLRARLGRGVDATEPMERPLAALSA